MARTEFGIYSSTEYALTNIVAESLIEAANFAETSVMSEVASLPQGLPQLEVIAGTDRLSTRSVGAIALGLRHYPTKIIPGIVIKESGEHTGNYQATVLTLDGLSNAHGVSSTSRSSMIPRLLKQNPEEDHLLWLNYGPLAAQKVAELKKNQEDAVAKRASYLIKL